MFEIKIDSISKRVDLRHDIHGTEDAVGYICIVIRSTYDSILQKYGTDAATEFKESLLNTFGQNDSEGFEWLFKSMKNSSNQYTLDPEATLKNVIDIADFLAGGDKDDNNH